MRNLLRNTYYLRMSAEQFSFLQVESGRLVSQPPLLAWRSVGQKRQPLAAGDAALDALSKYTIKNVAIQTQITPIVNITKAL